MGQVAAAAFGLYQLTNSSDIVAVAYALPNEDRPQFQLLQGSDGRGVPIRFRFRGRRALKRLPNGPAGPNDQTRPRRTWCADPPMRRLERNRRRNQRSAPHPWSVSELPLVCRVCELGG